MDERVKQIFEEAEKFIDNATPEELVEYEKSLGLNYDDYFGGMTEEQYQKETKEHFDYLEHLSKVNDEEAYFLLNKYKSNLFACEFVSDKEAEMLYYTILWWRDMCDTYYDEC